MAVPKDKFDQLFSQLPDSEKKSLLDYMEYLVERAARKAWDSIPEVDEPLSEEELQQLGEDREYLSGEEAKREFSLQVDLP